MWMLHHVLTKTGKQFLAANMEEVQQVASEGFALFSPNIRDTAHRMLTLAEAEKAKGSAHSLTKVSFKEAYQYMVSSGTTFIPKQIIVVQGVLTHPENASDIFNSIIKGDALFIVEDNDSTLARMTWFTDAEIARIAGHSIYAADFGSIYQHLISTYSK